MSLTVILQNDLIDISAPDENHFQSWIDTTLKQIQDPLPKHISELCIRIVDTNESAQLNQTFRQKQGATNILSFPSDMDIEFDDNSLGDMAICAEVVELESKQLAIKVEDHWAHLTIHGLLHLFGYDHITTKEAEVMEALEIKILRSLNINNPYKAQVDE